MIKVTFRTHDATRDLCLTLEGHAGQAVAGNDIVCASASILAYTVAQIVRFMNDDEALVGDPQIVMNSGDAIIACRCKSDEIYAKVKYAYDFAEVGFALLAHNYPQYVELNTVGKADKA